MQPTGCIADIRDYAQSVGAVAHCGRLALSLRALFFLVRITVPCIPLAGCVVRALFPRSSFDLLGHVPSFWVIEAATFFVAGAFGCWVSAFVHGAHLIQSSIEHVTRQVNEQVKAVQTSSDAVFDDSKWTEKVVEPARVLVQKALPRFSEFETYIMLTTAICCLAALLRAPELYARMESSNSTLTQGMKMGLHDPAPYILLIPLCVAYITVCISRAGDTLVNEIHQLVLEIELMDLQGTTLKKERVKALHQYLRELNGGQGPGFTVFGFVISMARLFSVGALVLTSYPLLLSWARSFV